MVEYNNSPIIESICEFRFTEDTSWDITVPGLIFEDVRKEYWRTTDEEYSENRKKFLTKLLKRERIFYALNDEYEIQTRINILNKLR